MNEDLIIQKLIELYEKVSLLVKQDDFSRSKEQATKSFDDQLVILQRLDQERLFTIERVKRIEEEVGRLKLSLNLA